MWVEAIGEGGFRVLGDDGVVDRLRLVRPGRLLADDVRRLHEPQAEVGGVGLGDRPGRLVAVRLANSVHHRW